MNSGTHKNDSTIAIEEIADQFIASIRNNENPQIEQFQERFPEFAEEIEQQFPGLLLAEKLAGNRNRNTSFQLQLPFVLGQYELLDEIGRGGMGVVYRACHVELDTEFAIKVMAHESPNVAKQFLRFKQEAQVVAGLHHRSIVPLIDYGRNGNLVYFVMRKIDGVTFRELFDEWGSKGSPAEKFKSICGDSKLLACLFAEIANALQYVHEQGLIHRDIKPSNLLIDKDSRVWISDFGLTKLTGSSENSNGDSGLSTTTGIVGTPKYLAPECARGTPDNRSDIYSLGVTMFEALSGISAWGQECKEFASYDGLSLPSLQAVAPAIPRQLSKIVSKACDPRPSERYQTAGELARKLREFGLKNDQGLLNRLLSKLPLGPSK